MSSAENLFTHIGLYVHIPFCRSKCRYCDFNSFSGMQHLEREYVTALCREMLAWSALSMQTSLPSLVAGLSKPRVSTIYIGGGTPTILSGDSIATILSTCRQAFEVDEDVEVTIEANPGTLSEGLLSAVLAAGVNRLSIGAQSFNPRLLSLLGRTHSALDTVKSVRTAFAAGFENVSLDLIYGIPGQSQLEWQEDLFRALELRTTHLSLYGLSVEDGTPLSSDVALGLLDAPDPDTSADMYQRAEQALSASGYNHYEISNWAKPGVECKHNLVYWRNLPYLGVGAGAHSSFCSIRLANTGSPIGYSERLAAAPAAANQASDAPALPSVLRNHCAVDQVEELDERTQMAETAVLGLRLSEGLDSSTMARRFGIGFEAAFAEEIERLCELGLLESSEHKIRLTSRGRLLGNEVFVRFF